MRSPPAHSHRVFAALRSPKKRLALVPGAHHNESLNERSWAEIAAWFETALATKVVVKFGNY
jgi:fermentation-respiration switch protein FrsA (DUF1100 family)